MSVLVTERLVLSPFSPGRKDYIDRLRLQVTWLNDKNLMRYSEQRHKKHTIPTQFLYIGNMDRLFYEIDYEGRLIGTIVATVDVKNRVADIGILIGDKNCHNKGLGLEAWNVLVNHLAGCDIDKIECGCMSINEPMIRLATKAGMWSEGKRRSHFLVDGNKRVDMLLFGRFL